MNRNDPRARELLWTGKTAKSMGAKKAILRALSPLDPNTLIFEVEENVKASEPSRGKKLFTSIRAFSLTACLSPALVCGLMGTYLEGWQIESRSFVLSLLALIFLQIAVNLFNDVEDHLNGVDLPGDIGGSGVIQKGWLSASTLAKLGYACLVVALALGIPSLVAHWQVLTPVALIALVGTLGYSGFGFRFKYRAMGDFVVFFLCGPLLMTGLSVAAFGKTSTGILIAGVVFGLASVGILHANNLNDLEVDQSRGARTLANQIGFKASKKYLFWIYLSAAFILAFAAALHWLPVWFALGPFLLVWPVTQLLKKVKQASGPLSPSIAAIRFDAAKIHLSLGIIWLAAFSIKWFETIR
ncbi:MAG: prenyltransferase [Bdellovibrionales bacterium]|nr:prenyltransferase [Oligoflexia bacterium]